MMIEQYKNKNEFSKFFNSEDYISLKNQLFNYKFRKYLLSKAYKTYSNRKEKVLLDVGCGISPVSPDYSKTIFIDADKNAMKILKKSGYKTFIGDVEKIPVRDNYADAIFSSEVLEHVQNYKKGLREFKRSLKKGGILFITVPTHMKYWAFDDDYVGHLRRFDPKKLENELKSEGFEILENNPIGSRIEREITKFLVRKAMSEKKHKIGKFKMMAFSMVNKIFFGLVYLAYLTNSHSNSSITLIAARKL